MGEAYVMVKAAVVAAAAGWFLETSWIFWGGRTMSILSREIY